MCWPGWDVWGLWTSTFAGSTWAWRWSPWWGWSRFQLTMWRRPHPHAKQGDIMPWGNVDDDGYAVDENNFGVVAIDVDHESQQWPLVIKSFDWVAPLSLFQRWWSRQGRTGGRIQVEQTATGWSLLPSFCPHHLSSVISSALYKLWQGLVTGSYYWSYAACQIPAAWLATKFGFRRIFGFSMLVGEM